jgi:hypothetical protein
MWKITCVALIVCQFHEANFIALFALASITVLKERSQSSLMGVAILSGECQCRRVLANSDRREGGELDSESDPIRSLHGVSFLLLLFFPPIA